MVATVVNTDFVLALRPHSAGDLSLNYYACNSSRMAPGLLQVHIRPVVDARVKRASNGRAVRVHNANSGMIHISFGRAGGGPVPAHSTEVFQLKRLGIVHHSVFWRATIGRHQGFAGSGAIRHLLLVG
jgi:hypothetical protein